MKEIKVKEDAIQIGDSDYLRSYLIRLGIAPDATSSFLTTCPPNSDIDNPYDLDSMDLGISLVHDAIEQGKKFYVQADCDTDGFTSASIFCSYFRSMAPQINLRWGVHSGKEHGIEMDKVGDADIVIIPDAGTMQYEEQTQLIEAGKSVLILDHHERTSITDTGAVIINNQISDKFSNKALSGAGVVLLFIKAYDEKYGDGIGWQRYMDLAAVGIIADVMDTRTLGNNYIIQHGLSHIRNRILQEILKSRAYSIADISHPTKTDVAFYIAPLINGLIRSGTQEEKEQFFRAMADDTLLETIATDGKSGPRTETVYEYVVRLASNAKGRQDNAKKRGSALLNLKIRENKLDEHTVIAVPVNRNEQDTVLPTLTGLTAMELSKQYHKPVLVLRENCDENGKVTYSGSLRADQYFETVNGELKPVPSLMDLINKSGLGWAEGHPFAAGCGFESSNLKAFVEYADEAMKNVDFTTEYIEVDYWFKDSVSTQILTSFANGMYVYGNGIPQPRFAFSFSMNASEFSFIGKTSDTIKFNRGGVEFVMFKQPALARQIQNSVKTRLTCVGRAQINGYNNRPQVVIDSLDLAEPTESISALDLI